MKALIKGGLCLALGWLASGVGAQDIQWRPATPKNTNPSAVAPANPSSIGIRPVTLTQPIPLDGTAAPPSFVPIIRAQAADDKTVPAVPLLEDKKTKPMPKGEFTPPTPTPVPGPSPVIGGLGMTPENGYLNGDCTGCGSTCGSTCGQVCAGRGWCGFGGLFGNADCCPERPRFWGSAEYLLFWQRGQTIPPLVTSSPAGTATAASGVLGQPTTSILYDQVPNGTRSGGSFTLGMWMPHFCNLGIEANYFFLGRVDNTQVFGSNGDPQIARPVFNAVTQKPAAEIVAINNPDRFVTGTVAVHNYSQLWGADINLRSKFCCGPTYWVDFLFGYRHLNLSEGLDVTENLQNFDPVTRAAAGHFLVHDNFETRNQFNGLQMGLDGEWRFCNRFFLGVTSKVALGSTHEIVNINGTTTFTGFPAPFGGTFPGGLLATPTNIGSYTQNRFAVMPEIGLKLGVDVTDHLRLFVGYDFMYLSNVVRPGEQIDPNVNPNFLPSAAGAGPGGGPRQPTVLFRTTDYWAQGLNFGLLYRY